MILTCLTLDSPFIPKHGHSSDFFVMFTISAYPLMQKHIGFHLCERENIDWPNTDSCFFIGFFLIDFGVVVSEICYQS